MSTAVLPPSTTMPAGPIPTSGGWIGYSRARRYLGGPAGGVGRTVAQRRPVAGEDGAAGHDGIQERCSRSGATVDKDTMTA